MRRCYAVVCLIFVFFAPSQVRAEDGTAVSKDGTAISFSVYGKGEPALVFVHGWSCNRSFWKKQVPYFENKYRVVTLDLAGHGRSGRGRSVYSMKAFGEDVAAVVRKINAHKVILIGHSMGGGVIIEAAEILPEEVMALVGIDTMHDFEKTYTPGQVEEIMKPYKDDFWKATDSFLEKMFVKGTDPDFIDGVMEMVSDASEKVGISAMEEMLKTSYIADLPKIKAPVWCLNSELWPTRPDINRKYVPKFYARIMPGVGHFLMLESPDEFNRELDDILKEILKK